MFFPPRIHPLDGASVGFISEVEVRKADESRCAEFARRSVEHAGQQVRTRRLLGGAVTFHVGKLPPVVEHRLVGDELVAIDAVHGEVGVVLECDGAADVGGKKRHRRLHPVFDRRPKLAGRPENIVATSSIVIRRRRVVPQLKHAQLADVVGAGEHREVTVVSL